MADPDWTTVQLNSLSTPLDNRARESRSVCARGARQRDLQMSTQITRRDVGAAAGSIALGLAASPRQSHRRKRRRPIPRSTLLRDFLTAFIGASPRLPIKLKAHGTRTGKVLRSGTRSRTHRERSRTAHRRRRDRPLPPLQGRRPGDKGHGRERVSLFDLVAAHLPAR